MIRGPREGLAEGLRTRCHEPGPRGSPFSSLSPAVKAAPEGELIPREAERPLRGHSVGEQPWQSVGVPAGPL